MNKHGGYHGLGQVIDYSVNINPIGLSDRIKDVLIASINDATRYPDIAGERARQTVAKSHNIDPHHVIMGNGASELIYLFARAIKPKKVLIIQPTFNEYERAFSLVGSEIVNHTLEARDNFKLHLEAFGATLAEHQPDVIVLCNPCNPSGQYIPYDQLEDFLGLISNYESYLFIDESFIEFTGHTSIIHHTHIDRVFSLRSMTKYYAVPGLRIGYGVGSEHIVQRLEVYKEPWTMNNLALSAVPAMIHNCIFHEQVEVWLREERQPMYKALEQIEHLHVHRSYTNFFLCKLHHVSGHELNKRLEPLGAHVRVCDDFTGLDESYIRIALRGHEENVKLIDLLVRTLAVK